MSLLFLNLGVPEIILVFIALLIPAAIILLVVSYFRKSQKLKQEQVDLLRKIADKKN